MNNKIEPHYVNFNTAKWLKEKGFDIDCKMCVEDEGERPLPFNCGNTIHKNSLHPYYSAPEQWQVVEFLRINHGIWIEVRHIKTFGVNRFHLIIWKYGEEDYHTIHCDNGVGYEVWDTPQAAYNAAFDYIKDKNLI
jgi:hypothetical protein